MFKYWLLHGWHTNHNPVPGMGDRAIVAYDITRVILECVVIPYLWLVSALEHFPDMWSLQNTCLAISRGQKVGNAKIKIAKNTKLVSRKPLIQASSL